MTQQYDYVIVGGGLAGASAVGEIRKRDADGSILLIGWEPHLPYHRPPLTKSLWSGTKTPADIFVERRAYYDSQNVETRLGRKVVDLKASEKVVVEDTGAEHAFGKLLLATGGAPRRLGISGDADADIIYYRYLSDFERLSSAVDADTRVLVIGGGFTGSEISASLRQKGASVTLIFPEPYLCSRVFPLALGMEINRKYRASGIVLIEEDSPLSIVKRNGAFVTTSRNGTVTESDLIVASIGIAPDIALAERGALLVNDGLYVNDKLQTSHPDIYAAGDNANIYYDALDARSRLEHWDAAIRSGAHAGKNMTGADQPYTELPFFFSDLFDFGYEAIGVTAPELDVQTIWTDENKTGIVCYRSDDRVMGLMMCNVWDKVDEARRIIEAKDPISTAQLKAAFGLT